MPQLQSINENMVFILERQNSVLEAKKSDTDDYILEGIAAVFGKENNNNRIYEESEYLPHLDYLKDKIAQNRLVGELDHPEKFDISLNNSAATATLGFAYKPSENWQLNSVISSGFRSPNIDDVGKIREKSAM